MTIGTEHEYSINNYWFKAQSASDEIIKSICGSYKSDVSFGQIILGKELQKTVIEIVPNHPTDNIFDLESQLVSGMNKFNQAFGNRYRLLGLGMHPTITLPEISVWNHNESEYYEMYDRLFNIRQHGWLNIQSLQINLSYDSEIHMVNQYNKIRKLLPYLIALTTSSPMVEGKMTDVCDNRLIYYINNQKEIPEICGGIIPEKIKSMSDYTQKQEKIYNEIRKYGADILCDEWVNSSGLIIRPSRKCLEIKAFDEQECIKSDMAVCAFLSALMRYPNLDLEDDRGVLLDITENVICNGTSHIRTELEDIYDKAWTCATETEKIYFPIIADRIVNGSLAEKIMKRKDEDIKMVMSDMANSLRNNVPYIGDD
jgi:gamma-glutamyl:cysteine ligase YbdK (ATP-grasp superfamily)